MIFKVNVIISILLCILIADVSAATALEEYAEQLDSLRLRLEVLEAELAEFELLPTVYADDLPLADLILKSNSRKIDVAAYLDAIFSRVTRSARRSFNRIDRYKLRSIDHDDLDVILAKADQYTHLSYDILRLVNDMVTRDDKELVLRSLGKHHRLVECVQKYNWVEEARDTLLAELRKRPRFIPRQWIECVVQLQDESIYAELRWRFMNTGHERWLYEAIKDIPEFDMKSMVYALWERPLPFDDYDRQWRYITIASYGKMEALEELVAERLKEKRLQYVMPMDDFFLRHVEKKGTATDIQKWLRAYRGDIVFDAASGVYVLGEDK